MYNFYTPCRNRPINRKSANVPRPTDFSLGEPKVPDARFYSAGAVPVGHVSRPDSPVFPRQKRFPRTFFPEALRNSRRFSSSHFAVLIPERGEGYAVVVPKKVARLSVTRHRIKRQISEILRTIPLPTALIVFSRSPLDDVHYEDMKKELTDLLSRLPR